MNSLLHEWWAQIVALARPDALVAIGGVDGPAALAMMGLEPIPVAGPA